MSTQIIAEWSGREHNYDPKSADWYWALGIVAVASTIAATLFGSYVFALLIIIAASALALHAAKEPPLHHFRLIDSGIMIGEDLHLFETMRSFCVLEDTEGELPVILSIKTRSWHSPHLLIPLEGANEDLIYTYLLHHVDEEAHHHTVIDLVAAWLRL